VVRSEPKYFTDSLDNTSFGDYMKHRPDEPLKIAATKGKATEYAIQNQKNPFFHFFSSEKSFFLDVVNVSLSGEETAVTDSKRGFF